MPNQIEAFKLAESTGMGNRRLWMAMLIAIIVGILATFWANLDHHLPERCYCESRWIQGMGWKGVVQSASSDGSTNPTEPNVIGIGFYGHRRVIDICDDVYADAFPVVAPSHPAGYALAISFAMDYFWFRLLCGMVSKTDDFYGTVA